MLLITGSYSKISEPGIQFYRWNGDTNFRQTGSLSGIDNPSYIAVDDSRQLLYAITEKKKDAAAELHIYQLLNTDGPKLVSCLSYEGAGSCFISCDTSGTHAFITNYGDGTLTVIGLPQANRPGSVVQTLRFSGSGPDKERQEQSHLHAAVLSPDGQHLYCSDLGADRLYHFLYQVEASLPLLAAEKPYVELPPGSGPRHIAISSNGKRIYLITELSGEIFVFDAQNLKDRWLQKVSLVQNGYAGKIEAADIQLHPNGGFLYATNRGDANEILVFQVDPINGQLEFLQRIGAAGLSPRGITICEQQGLLLAANEQSDNISIFKLLDNGLLEYTREHLQVSCPTCVKTMNI